MSPVFIGSDVFRRQAFVPGHPLSIPRVGAVIDMCLRLGWLGDGRFMESPRAGIDALARFHDVDYIDAVRRADEAGAVDAEVARKTGLGSPGNPVFPGMFARATTACGGSLLAAALALDGRVAFNPAGGTHHGFEDRARGFCYFNDPVLAIYALLDGGLGRVLYVDFDAHHGDGVQRALSGDSRVLTVSVHEARRWPRTGAATDRGAGNARNLPVPEDFNDAELAFLMEAAVLPLAEAFRPEACVVLAGADNLSGDPLTGMALSNAAVWRAVGQVADLTEGTVILGGGGYDPWNVVRAWSGLWGVLNGFPLPDPLPAPCQDLLSHLAPQRLAPEAVPAAKRTTLTDFPNQGPVRAEVRALPLTVLAEEPPPRSSART